jgi:DNA-binding response OmpR family regulator
LLGLAPPCSAGADVVVSTVTGIPDTRYLLGRRYDTRSRLAVTFQLHSNRTVLLIDDDERLHAVIDFALEGTPFELVVAPSAAAGLEVAVRAPPAIVLLDVTLPDSDGVEVCARLKADPRTSAVPVVMLSGHAAPADRARAEAAGAAAYLVKPFRVHELLAHLERWATP